MAGGNQLLDQVVVTLRNQHGNTLPVIIDVYNNSLSRKWLRSLTLLIRNNFHLEKNYCFLGFANSPRDSKYIISEINKSILAINSANLGYTINDYFSEENTVQHGPVGQGLPGLKLVKDKMNMLHRYFEDLQGSNGNMSPYYTNADSKTRWHIRQLNLLCHEYESLILSRRKKIQAPEWQRPSQLMCWLQAPRFELDSEDFELFGIETINRPLGGVYVGVNKAVGKHHWEVFCDEGSDSRVGELTTTTLQSQTLAAGDFDIEWGQYPGAYPWQQTQLAEFQTWLVNNDFDPNDKTLTIGHPKVGQVNLMASFGTTDYLSIWQQLNNYMDVYKISTSETEAVYNYHWSDPDYREQQTRILK